MNAFNILDHVEKLEPHPKQRGVYVCPVCGDDNLKISKDGAYKCFSHDCKAADIRNAIAPLTPEAKANYRQQKAKPKSKKEKERDAVLAAAEVELKANELALAIEAGYQSPRQAQVTIAAWAKEHGHNVFAAQQLLKELTRQLPDDDNDEQPKELRDYGRIRAKFGDRLRYNTLRNQVELDGTYFPPATAKLHFAIKERLNLKSCRDDVGDIVVMIARENSYSPVVEYLTQVSQKHTAISILDNLAERYLATRDPLHQTLLMKFLVSAVARAFEPGCQVDTVLVLQGKQGYQKSTFFKTLGSPWFDGNYSKAAGKDEILRVHSAWILESAEFESVFKRKDMSELKAFITTREDLVRPPYGRSIEWLKRASVFVGTTNEQGFLSDSTGNRRFWIIPVSKPIDCNALAQERDRIWAAAVHLYQQGEPWWLSADEEEQIDQERELYRSTDPWCEVIAEYVQHIEEVSSKYLLDQVLKIEVAQQNVGHHKRIGSILRELGWERVLKRQNGNPIRVWVKA